MEKIPAPLPGPSTTPPVETPKPTSPASASADSPSAKVTAPLFGGYRGGRKRADGLKGGSKEAVLADREKDRLRKERDRQAGRALLEPAPLPSAPGAPSAGAPSAGAPAGGPEPALAGSITASFGSPRPDSFAPAPAFIPWEAQSLKPLFDQLIPTVETLTVHTLTHRAEKAKLPTELVKEIGRDAAWNAPARKAVELTAPQVAAKWLNKAGLSAENQAELVLGTAIVSIAANQTLLLRKLDKLIAERITQEGQSKGLNNSPR